MKLTKHNLQIETPPQIGVAHSVSLLTGTPNISKFSHLYLPLSTRFIAVRCTVRFGLICPCSSKKQIKLKNLALLTTYIQSHETQCILRAIDSIKELFPVYQEGERLVPVPMQDIGCEVGLHGGKWGEVPEYKREDNKI